eukprot:TRINITY_DN6953_c0_g1_i1.p1 TRINITY_DN6953_c0_g1~~TRINITY_DN6953_c0_g1_i1.p1  ORF type:complete len:517 (-),score=78.23 TRINITY_DN6953_c0_g1_i1:16-1566(-)
MKYCVLVFFYFSFILCNNVTVMTQYGPVTGIEENGFRVFKGIPYAEPPIGSLRWSPPVMKKAWGPTPLDTTRYGACCAQEGSSTPSNVEDCLFLNIWTPPPQENKLYPVMLWIHGGGFERGCSSQNLFYSDFIANSTSTVVVTFNYRLGVLGFLASTELQGNYGIMDQQFVFDWVQHNIKQFGGDPGQVTIYGQSAGSISVGLHMTSPLSFGKNWFHRAIMESNVATLQFRTYGEQEVYSHLFADYLNCSIHDLSCIRSKNVDEIINAQAKVVIIPIGLIEALQAMPWEPTVDGKIVIDQPVKLFQEGKFVAVPTIIGVTRNETCSFEFNNEKIPIPEFLYKIAIDYEFGNSAAQVLQHYPPLPDGDNRFVLEHLSTDYLFLCSSRRIALGIAKANVPIYMYIFLHSPLMDPSNNFESCKGQVCHGAELPYVFHSAPFCGAPQTPEEVNLTNEVVNFWTSFAHGHNLSDVNQAVQWPLFTPDVQQTMGLDIPLHIENGYHRELCDFWDTLLNTKNV